MISDDLKRAVEEDPRSGREIAAEAKIAEGTIRYLFRGGITLVCAEKLAKALGFSIVLRRSKKSVDKG